MLAGSTLSDSGCGPYCCAVTPGPMFAFWLSLVALVPELQGHLELPIKASMLHPWVK